MRRLFHNSSGHYAPIIIIGLVVISVGSIIGFTIYSDIKNGILSQHSSNTTTAHK